LHTIRCVSLLGRGRAEEGLSDAFPRALGSLPSAGVQGVCLVAFDLGRHLERSSEAMAGFLRVVAPLADGDGFCSGSLPGSVETQQRGPLRFNCADSLDRTNVATFYFALKVNADWCRQQNV
jgi:hypothetical protein